MNNLPYNHDMRESLLQKSLFSLDVWSFAKVLMLDLACVKNIACLLGEKKKKNTWRKESLCPFERTGGSVPVGLKDSCCHSQEPRFSRPLVWAIPDSSSKLSASPGRRPIPPPAPLFYRSEHWAALRDPSCPYKFSWTAPTPGMLRVTTCCSDSLVAGVWKMQHRNTAFVAAGQATRFFRANNQTPT